MIEFFNIWANTKQPEALIHAYVPEEKKTDIAIVIFPGGAYVGRAEHEGKGYAEFLNSNGISAFVVDYRVTPNYFPLPLLDARRAVQNVRFYSEKFGINKDKVYVMGSSAGGHLAATVSNLFDEIDDGANDEISKEGFIPNGQILCYPVINFDEEGVGHAGSAKNLLGENIENLKSQLSIEKIVSEKTPKAFVWHTAEDAGVNVINSLNYTKALKQNGVDFELHVFPHGRHGLGLAKTYSKANYHVSGWKEMLIRWLEYND